MTEKQQQLLKLINDDSELNVIKEKLNLSDKQLIRMLQTLKNNGLNICSKFNDDGLHRLAISKEISTSTTIEAKGDINLKLLAISDTHLISKYEDMKAIDKAYDYAARNNIKYVLHAGDLIDGVGDNIKSLNKKVDEMLKQYPSDKNITTFLILGNHDSKPIKKLGYNIENKILGSRLDLIPLGIDYGKININNSVISLYHKEKPRKYKEPSALILKGHSHIYKEEEVYVHRSNKSSLILNLPSLSNIRIDNYYTTLQKGFVALNLEGVNYISKVNLSFYTFYNGYDLMKLTETSHILTKK